MKILLIGFAKIKYMPYLNFYLESIDRDKHDVHLLYWNRDLTEEDLSGYENVNMHEFRCYQEDNVSRRSKIVGFIKYCQYAKKVIKKNDFDFAIILHSFPGVLLHRIWIKRFKNKYIFDYRDSTYERYSFYKRIIAKLIANSKGTFTSSDGFRVFFPKEEQHRIYTSHNILTDSLSHREYEKTACDKIRIAFWGFMREEETNKQVISSVARDKRFELHFYGREQQIATNLRLFAEGLCADNVFFHGAYTAKDRYEFVKNTDIIHNVYRSHNAMLAMGNKYYDGAIFRIPQLCMRDSFMGKAASEGGIGFECDPFDEGFTDNVLSYFTELDRESFNSNCDAELDRLMEQYASGTEFLKQIFEQ